MIRRRAPAPVPSLPDMAHHRPTILIAGAGVAGLEALIALRHHLGGMVHIELLDPASAFAYRPMSVAEPFDEGSVRRFDLMKIAIDHGADHRCDGLASVDAERHIARTSNGWELSYDRLVVAVGGRPRNVIPGALTFRGPEDAAAFAKLLGDVEAGTIRRVIFALPVGVLWSLPLYELALMTAEHLHRRGVGGVSLEIATPEAVPLKAFGRRAGERFGELLAERGISVRPAVAPRSFEAGALALADGSTIPADRVVALARPTGPWIPGLPHDAEGFIPTDRYGAVPGAPDVYAAGDGTTFPIKQGGIAAQQADVVAAAIAAGLGAPVSADPFRPVLRGLLLDGRTPRYLRGEPRGERTAHVEVSLGALWWPPSKIAAPHLAPYLADPQPHMASDTPLAERPERNGRDEDEVEAEHHEVAELNLALADHNARWGEYRLALRCLDAVEMLEGKLPPGYAAKRRDWSGRIAPRH